MPLRLQDACQRQGRKNGGALLPAQQRLLAWQQWRTHSLSASQHAARARFLHGSRLHPP
ncbi:hypothetical protein LE191_06770 [Janthinobacterium sp. HSC-3S05]|uniref:hypothetical protein n=1 Tax=Janthinobacterium lividum TaxID=29581 RepID=UPI001CD8F8B5|nr:hypothetical protein [Janthinobacterium lividum]MCA1859813.1 hypothetical protein [Janthinobacterium lividum]